MSSKDQCVSSCDRAVFDRNGARIVWVDVARGVAMLAILLFHTEMRYAEGEIIPYSMYVENFLALFFFVSGYLFVSPKRQFSLRGKLVSIAKRLVVPYVLFVSLMAVPKAYAHVDDLTLWSFFGGLVSGRASWFVSALIVVSLYYALVEHLLCRLIKSLLQVPLHGLCTSFSRGLWGVGRVAPDFVAKTCTFLQEIGWTRFAL